MTTIYDIAKEAGVSITTVSRVINQKKGISETTRKKVSDILKKHNYLPSPSAKGLAEKNNHTVVVITEDIRDMHYANTIYTIEQELNKRKIYCILFNTGKNQEDRVKAIENAMQLRANGVILIGSTFENKHIQKAITRYIPETPIVIANGYIDLPNVCGVICDGKSGMKKIVRHLIEKGHKNIGYVGNTANTSAIYKQQGYLEVMKESGFDSAISNPEGDDELFAGKAATEKLLSGRNITAIVYEKDIFAIGGAHYLHEKGLIIPDDIAIAGFDNSFMAKSWIPGITSVDDKIGVMGTKCVQALFEMIEEGVTVAQMMLIPEIVIRESTIGKKE